MTSLPRRWIVPALGLVLLAAAATASLVLWISDRDDATVAATAENYLRLACGIHQSQRHLSVDEIADGIDGLQTNAIQAEGSLFSAAGVLDHRDDLTTLGREVPDAVASFSDDKLDETRTAADKACDGVDEIKAETTTYAAYTCAIAERLSSDVTSLKDLGALDEDPAAWEVSAIASLGKAAATDPDHDGLAEPAAKIMTSLQQFDDGDFKVGLAALEKAC